MSMVSGFFVGKTELRRFRSYLERVDLVEAFFWTEGGEDGVDRFVLG